MLTWRGRVLFAGLLLTPPSALTQETAGSWELTPLAVTPLRSEDDPTVAVRELGDAYWYEPTQDLLFWGRIREKPEQWALFSWREGKVRLIAAEGKTLRSRYTDKPIPHIFYSKGAGNETPAETHGGKVLFVSARGGLIRQSGAVYTWDGARLAPSSPREIR